MDGQTSLPLTTVSWSVRDQHFQIFKRGLSERKALPGIIRNAIIRNARRREEFLNKKIKPSTADNQSQSEVSEEEAEAPLKAPSVLHHHPSPSPSSERRQVINVGREKTRPSFSQLDGDPPSSPNTASGLQSSSPPPSSAPAPPSADYDELIAYLKTRASQPPDPMPLVIVDDKFVFKSSSCDKSEAS